jgi:MYXO-CTERM domain-containing protein
MFKRIAQAALCAGVMALAPLSTAKAVCTSGSFNFCFTFTFNTNSATVQYASGVGTFTAFGIEGYSSYAGLSVSSTAGSFSLANASSCNAGSFGSEACATSNNGINGGFPPIASVTLSFSGNASAPTSPAGTVHIQGANGLTGCSLWINSSGVIIAGLQDPSCQTTTTPEPASAALVATGLLGLGGGLIRRRRKNA